MLGLIITSLQLFAIGFGLGIAGPCILSCMPILAAYAAGSGKGVKAALSDVLYLLTGRLLAYVVLGFLAGLSGSYIRRLSSFACADILRCASGVIVIALGIALFFDISKNAGFCLFKKKYNVDSKSLFLAGFVIGISPCLPLIALLLEVAIMSKNALQGALYSLFFGLGTLVSGMIIVGPVAGMLSYFSETLKEERSRIAFRFLCGFLLLSFGLFILFGRRLYYNTGNAHHFF